MNEFFVMIHRQDGTGVMPMTRNDEVAMYPDSESAMEAAQNNDAATCFGFDIFQMGGGIDGSGGL